jgi:hypothetical protein
MNAMVYRSRVDPWLLIPFTGLTLTCVYAAYRLMQLPRVPPWLALLPLAIVVTVPLWSVLRTRYTLSDEALRIRCGPFAWRIALRDISRIEPTRDAGSSPALSLDRLRIHYGDGRSVMISPADKQDFLRDFAVRRAGADM